LNKVLFALAPECVGLRNLSTGIGFCYNSQAFVFLAGFIVALVHYGLTHSTWGAALRAGSDMIRFWLRFWPEMSPSPVAGLIAMLNAKS